MSSAAPAATVALSVAPLYENGRIAKGLSRDNFRVFEDNVEQRITEFRAGDEPASLVVVFDSSKNMSMALSAARHGVANAMEALAPDSEVAVVEAAELAQLAVPFTTKSDTVLDWMNKTRARGAPPLYDAVLLAIGELQKARHARRAVLIVSACQSGADTHTSADLRAELQRTNTALYVSCIGSLSRSGDTVHVTEANPQLGKSGTTLRDAALESSGIFVWSQDLETWPRATAALGGLLRYGYVLGYESTNAKRDGRYRRITVKLNQPRGLPALKPVHRQGYYAQSQ